MNEKPRKTDDFIITKAMRKNILGVGFCFLAILMTLIVIIKQMPADLVGQAFDAILHDLRDAAILESI